MRGHAALKSVPFLGSVRELDPICRKPKPASLSSWLIAFAGLVVVGAILRLF
jgi:hypothetical protein